MFFRYESLFISAWQEALHTPHYWKYLEFKMRDEQPGLAGDAEKFIQPSNQMSKWPQTNLCLAECCLWIFLFQGLLEKEDSSAFWADSYVGKPHNSWDLKRAAGESPVRSWKGCIKDRNRAPVPQKLFILSAKMPLWLFLWVMPW